MYIPSLIAIGTVVFVWHYIVYVWQILLSKQNDCFSADLETEEPDVVFSARQKIATLGSCFSQLTHKALTIFQNNAKLEVWLFREITGNFLFNPFAVYRNICVMHIISLYAFKPKKKIIVCVSTHTITLYTINILYSYLAEDIRFFSCFGLHAIYN